MHGRLRAPVLIVCVCLSTAAAASADPITYRFEGRVDVTTGTVPPSIGDSLFGSVTFDIPGTDAPPGSRNGFFQTRQDVFHLSFAHGPGGPIFNERTLHRQLFTVNVFDDFSGDFGDALGITLSSFTFPQFNFHIDLIDLTASAFANANLPRSPNLDAFQLRNFTGNIQVRSGGGQSVVGTFGGIITSFVGGPGPSLVPEPCSLLLFGPAAIGIFARGRIKRSRWTEAHITNGT